MSKVETRFPLHQAMPWAQELANAVADFSSRVHIAGSIRRERALVGDVDLVVLDDSTNPWIHSAIAGRIQGLGYFMRTDGPKIQSFAMPERPSLDIYYATPETWGITLLVRTGSAAHNIRLVDRGKRRTPQRHLMVSRGIVDTADNVVASREELDVFTALGLNYIEPEDREAPELEHMVRQEIA